MYLILLFYVQELVRSQTRLCSLIPGFRYNLGYVGAAFKSSPIQEENAADQLLAEHAYIFDWFPHTFNHTKPHLQNISALVSAMRRNKEFAKVRVIALQGSDFNVALDTTVNLKILATINLGQTRFQLFGCDLFLAFKWLLL